MKLLSSDAVVSDKCRITGFGLVIIAGTVSLFAGMEAILLFRAPTSTALLDCGVLAAWKLLKAWEKK